MSQYVFEITFFTSQTCLSPGEQIIKYSLKFFPEKSPNYVASFTVAARFEHSQA